MQRSDLFRVAATAALILPFSAAAQSTSGVINGVAKDSTGAAVSGATIVLSNPVSGYQRTATSNSTGQFTFLNLPFDRYQISASSTGLRAPATAVQVYSTVPITANLVLAVAAAGTTVTVEADAGLPETDPTFHTDVDRSVIERTPIESPSSALSSLVTLLSPGVAADSNGLMHGLGDHAENSFSLDGEQITDQQSKVFSNQIPAEAVQSMEVIDGAPTAEYGDKTSLIVKVTTRSGQGVTTPTGAIRFSYGTFGTSNVSANLAYGGANWGNFIEADGLNSGRFLDTPEFTVLHDKGNEENFFDRLDVDLSSKDSLHIDGQYTRSWFQNPNDFENYNVLAPNGTPVGNADQRAKIETVNFAPTYTRLLSPESVLNLGFYVRHDGYNYYPSNNPLADYAPDQQQETISQFRTLTNVGLHGDVSYVHGINSAKFGGRYEQTFLRENDSIGIIDPTITPSCVDSNGNPANCSSPGGTPNPNLISILLPYDLTQGGSNYNWHGRTDVKELALYGEDQVTVGNWTANFGLRGDFYNGLTVQRQAEPRAGLTYGIKKTGTVLRASYARTQETPFNENLVLSNNGCADPVLYAIFSTLSEGNCVAPTVTPFNPGFRNEFHAGIGQGIGRHFVFNGEYIWKYTHNAYDFSVLGTTPITFPIEWHNSKIPGVALSAVLTDIKGFSVRFNASSVAARFFNPQIGGVGATPVSTNVSIANGLALPFRIDHDEHFNQTTHLEYRMPFRKSLYYGFNWRYDSGLVAGAAPCYNATPGANTDCDPSTAITVNGQPGIDLTYLSADQQFQAGLVCTDGGVADKATPSNQLQQCSVAGLQTKLLSIPGLNMEDADKDPNRVAPRNVFDMQLGDDNLAHFGEHERYRLTASVTAINMANKYALYNFLSTFSGTHYVTPRTVTGEIAFHF